MTPIAVELDGVLGDTRPLWEAWLLDVSRRAHIDAVQLDRERLDEELPNWRVLLERFAEDHAAVYLRPSAPVAGALRRLQAAGVRIGVFTEAPEELARIAVGQLGAARRIEALEAGPGSLERLLARLGPGTRVARSLAELERNDQPASL
jgi:phosphoglycolate phosphatase-like HAD superfamily hydrolase